MADIIRIESDLDDFEAWVELPKEWLKGQYSIWVRAANDHAVAFPDDTLGECWFTGAVQLIVEGIVKVQIPGLDFEQDIPDLSGVTVRSYRFLLDTIVRHPQHGINNQNVPFTVVSSSMNGSRATEDEKMVIPD